MSEWQPIESAPKDGTRIWVRRIYKGDKIHEGWAAWTKMAKDAPMRQWSPGGLDGPLPPDHAFADTPTWLTGDRRFCVPGPTQWKPEP